MKELIGKKINIILTVTGNKITLTNALVVNVTDTHISLKDAKTGFTKWFKIEDIEEVTHDG